MNPNYQAQPSSIQFGSNVSVQQNQSDSTSSWTHLIYHINQQVDKEPSKLDLYDLVKSDQPTIYTPPNTWQGPKLVKTIDLEGAVNFHSNLNQNAVTFKFSSEIGKVYSYHAQNIRFWDPIDGKMIFEFQEPSQNIVTNLAIIPSNPEIFNQEISNLMIICTLDKLSVYGLQIVHDQIRVIHTHVSCNIPNELYFTCIKYDDDCRRVYLSGSDGFIYELRYNHGESLFFNETKLICLNRSFLGSLINIPIISSTPSMITDMVIDNSRRLLYCLHECSLVQVFSLGTKNNPNFRLVTKLSDLKKKAIEHYPQSPYTNTLLPTSIQSLHVVPLSQSSTIHLVAVSQLGHRVYLQLLNEASITHSNAHLKIVFVKSPPIQSLDIPSNPRSATLFNHGVSLMYGGSTHEGSKFVITYPLGKLSSYNFSNTTSAFQSWETFESIQLEADFEAWQIYELPTTMLSKLFTPLSTQNQNLTSSTSSSWGIQLFSPPRHFMVVSFCKIYIFALPRPIDQLAEILNQDPPQKSLLDQFIAFYGSPLTTTMSLSILNHRSLSFSSHLVPGLDSSLNELDSKVIKLFFDMADSNIPLFANLTNPPHYPHLEVIGKPLPSLTQVSFKEKLHGITLYMSQLISSVWRKSLIKHDKTKNQATITEWIPSELKLQLEEFLQVLNKIEPYYTESSHCETNSERTYFFEVKKLAKYILEVAELFILICSHLNLEEAQWDWTLLVESKPLLASVDELQLDHLVTTPLGKDTLNELTYWFAQTSAGLFDIQRNNVLASALTNKCSTLCPAEALILLQAEQYLQLAMNMNDQVPAIKYDYLKECLKYLTQPSASLSQDRLGYFVQQFINLEFFSGAIDLILHHANKVAVSSNSSQNESDPPHVSIYRVLFLTLKSADQHPRYRTMLNELSQKCRHVEDPYFHNLVYQYLLDNQKDLLLQMDTSLLVPFLSSIPPSIPRLEALVDYYKLKFDFQKVSSVYSQLAYDTSLQIAIDKRVEYLVFAVSYLRRINPEKSNTIINDRLNELEYSMKVGRIQLQLYDPVPSPFTNPRDLPPPFLLSAEELLNSFIVPQRQYISLFNLLELSSQIDPIFIKDTWQSCITYLHQQYPDSASEKIQMGIRIIYDNLSTSSPIFPAPMINHILLNYHWLQQGSLPDLWVWGVMELCGFSMSDVLLYWEGLKMGKLSPWSESQAMDFLNHQIGLLSSLYVKKHGSQSLKSLQGENLLEKLYKEKDQKMVRLPSKRSAEDDLSNNQRNSKLV